MIKILIQTMLLSALPVSATVCDLNLESGELIQFDKKGVPQTPNQPVIGFIEGDGIGAEITPVMQAVVDAAVAKAYGPSRKIHWRELIAGDKAITKFGEPLPEQTLKDMENIRVSIKGPMNTPVGAQNGDEKKNFRSLNVAIRKHFCLYSCERPVVKFPNVPTPLMNADKVDMMIFRQNTEDVYAGVEFRAGSPEAVRLAETINQMLAEKGSSERVSAEAGIGIKPMTKEATLAIMRRALNFAIAEKKPSITIVHKGNIQKYTEGAFRDWAYELAVTEYREHMVTEEELYAKFGGKVPEGKIVVKDRIADNMFQQTILYPERYSVIVASNLNGDYLSDQIAALVGGLGIAPGANIGDNGAVFEATHGTAPDIAGKNMANPSSLILSAVMMLKYLGWNEAAAIIDNSLRATFTDKIVTGDFRNMPGAQVVGTKEFGQAVIERIQKAH